MLGFDEAAKRFGAVTALDRCTFAARPGRLTGFLGPSGAGKTTAIRAVFGLSSLTQGQPGGRAYRSARQIGRDSAICRRSGVCIRGCACGISWCISASCAGAGRKA
jgi:ABC-type multidrug transport system ATPase subunit